MNADGTNPKRIATGEAPVWSPDGKRIAFTTGTGVFTINADGTEERLVLGADPPYSLVLPSWSPDGESLAFARHEEPSWQHDIWALDLASGRQRQLTDSTLDPLEPTVQVRDVRTNAVKSVARIAGVQAIALSRRFVAVLVSDPSGSKRLAVLDARTGVEKRAVQVPQNTPRDLSIAGADVVFRLGRTIRLLHAATGRTSVVATAAAKPIGLSIEGRRIAWAENIRGRGRIRAVLLPKHA
jgi:dipeptidyl aminopeptidase/acylaminoacyl peptidase